MRHHELHMLDRRRRHGQIEECNGQRRNAHQSTAFQIERYATRPFERDMIMPWIGGVLVPHGGIGMRVSLRQMIASQAGRCTRRVTKRKGNRRSENA
jgi:hypothetical protein